MNPQDEATALIADLNPNSRMRLLTAHDTLMKFVETISVVAQADGSVQIHASAALSLDEFKGALAD